MNLTTAKAYEYGAKPEVTIRWTDGDGTPRVTKFRGDAKPIYRSIAKRGGRIVDETSGSGTAA